MALLRGISGVEGVGEVAVLHPYGVTRRGYAREHVFVPAYGCEGRVVLDPAQPGGHFWE